MNSKLGQYCGTLVASDRGWEQTSGRENSGSQSESGLQHDCAADPVSGILFRDQQTRRGIRRLQTHGAIWQPDRAVAERLKRSFGLSMIRHHHHHLVLSRNTLKSWSISGKPDVIQKDTRRVDRTALLVIPLRMRFAR